MFVSRNPWDPTCNRYQTSCHDVWLALLFQCSDDQHADFALFTWIKLTNLDIKDAACHYVIHILQHPTSRPSTKSTDNTLVNAPKKNLSPLPAVKYCKSTKHPTKQHYHGNEGKTSLEVERVRALGALRSLRSKTKFAVGNQR